MIHIRINKVGMYIVSVLHLCRCTYPRLKNILILIDSSLINMNMESYYPYSDYVGSSIVRVLQLCRCTYVMVLIIEVYLWLAPFVLPTSFILFHACLVRGIQRVLRYVMTNNCWRIVSDFFFRYWVGKMVMVHDLRQG